MNKNEILDLIPKKVQELYKITLNGTILEIRINGMQTLIQIHIEKIFSIAETPMGGILSIHHEHGIVQLKIDEEDVLVLIV